jgi:hypothetical protein
MAGYSRGLLALVAAGLLLILPVGCSGESPNQQAPPPSPTAPAPLPPAPPAPVPEPVSWSADGVISPGEYAVAVEYGEWQISWRSDETHFYCGVRARTSGFVSLGIQPGRAMKDADMIFCYVADGAVTVLDLYSTGSFGPHKPDTELGGRDDILESGGSEADGFTTVEFKRALVTGDEYDRPLSPGVNKIIWAYGSSDSLSNKHSSRGYGEINIE